VTYGLSATEYLLHLGIKPERILQSQNAVDEKRFRTAARPAWDIQPRPVVLYVGQLIERKGISLLLDAAARLQQQGYEFSLLLVGNGREKQALERRAHALGLKNVHFRSAQPPEKMPAVYRSADLLVFPTLEDVWGLVANEAILSGIPVLCSKYAGCASELFRPEAIFSPEDLDEFCEKLAAALSGRLPKPDLRRLKTTNQLGRELVQDVNTFIAARMYHSEAQKVRISAETCRLTQEPIGQIVHEPSMSTANRKLKLALLTNMIAPYRLPLYSVLADEFDLLLLHGGKEANRDAWSDLEEALPNASVVRAWGWQIRHTKKLNGKAFDEKFIHVTPGFLWHLLFFRPDAIISNEMGFRSVVALAYGLFFSKPVWIWWEGTLHSERGIGFSRKILRKAFAALAERWVSFGQTSTEYLVHLGVKPERILQSQNAVDEERFRAAAPPAWDIQPRPVVLYVGQLIERKGVGLLLDAAAALQQGNNFSLLVVGSGHERPVLQRRAQTLGLKNVHFKPAQPPDKMPSVYRSADLLVFPTLEDVWGLVANEAILSGIPVLCSKYAGCAGELFAPEHLFAPDDLHEFSQKLGVAISAGLSKADPTRLKTTQQLGGELVQQLRRWLPPAPTTVRNESGVSSDSTIQSAHNGPGGTRQSVEDLS